MNKIIFFLFAAFCLHTGYVQSENKLPGQDFTAPKIEEFDTYLSENKVAEHDKALSDSIQSLLQSDPYLSDPLSSLKKQGIHILESADKMIRIVSWKKRAGYFPSADSYCHIVQYNIAPGKTRFAYFGFDCGHYDRFTYDYDMYISKIHDLDEGTYILEGVQKYDYNNEYKLIGIDIGRGILKNAYIFSEEGNDASMSFSVTYNPDCTIESEYILREWHLQVPVLDENGCLTSDYSDYYFNGAYFVNGNEYEELLPDMLEEKDIITRLYYKDGDNMNTIMAYSPTDPISLITDVSRLKGNELKDIPYTIKLSSTDDDEHESGQTFEHSLILRLINNKVFIESINTYYLKADDTTAERSYDLKRVIYTAGREKALPYEWLRYTAVAFNCLPSEEECKSVRWAIEIEEELYLLDADIYSGTQIDLQMKEEWIGKEIYVIPYIKVNEIYRDIAIKTLVLADNDYGTD